MRGLMRKDVYLLRKQLKLIGFFFLFIIAFSLKTGGVEFGLAYMTFMVLSVCQSTLSYDEFDRGYPFLLSLPISRKDYVREKYLFCLIMGLGVLGLMVAILLVLGLFFPGSLSLVSLGQASYVSVIGLLLFSSILLAVSFHFGAEKSRTAIFVVVIGIVAGLAGLTWLVKRFGLVDIFLKAEPLAGASLVGGFLLSLLVSYLSYRFSLKTFLGKEF